MSRIEHLRGNDRLTIAAEIVCEDLKIGDSVSINGVCLTVVDLPRGGFSVEATSHTLAESSLSEIAPGRKVNLERALRVGDRLGGHIVQGHVDGVGRVTRIRYNEGSTDLFVEMDRTLMRLMAPRGSVTLDGVSLTIAEKSANGIRVMLVPLTLEKTTLGELKPGDRINIESDLIIRWLADRFPDGPAASEDSLETPEWGQFHLED